MSPDNIGILGIVLLLLLLVARMHVVDCGETLVFAHAIEEVVNELADAGLAAGRLERRIAGAIWPFCLHTHSGLCIEGQGILPRATRTAQH